MTYRLLLFSEEVENFVMEIMTPPSATFLELHSLIMKECGYTENGNHRFLICNDAWRVKEKIHLKDTGKIGLDEDLYLMKDCILDDFVDENDQHIAYVYDTESKSTFLLDIVETLFGEKTEKAYVRRRKGTAPAQFQDTFVIPDVATIAANLPNTATDSDREDAAEEDTFSEDELDTEGFEVSEMQ